MSEASICHKNCGCYQVTKCEYFTPNISRLGDAKSCDLDVVCFYFKVFYSSNFIYTFKIIKYVFLCVDYPAEEIK